MTSAPCFNYRSCQGQAAVEKAGKSLCRGCADHAKGREYPLREPGNEPIYFTGLEAADTLEMIEDRRPPILGRREA